MEGLVVRPVTAPPVPDPFAEALNCDLSFTTGSDVEWYTVDYGYYDRVILLGPRVRYPTAAKQETLLKFC